jgi:hypothetical protein
MKKADFNDKWDKNNYLCNSDADIFVKEKYLYYYTNSDVENIIEKWLHIGNLKNIIIIKKNIVIKDNYYSNFYKIYRCSEIFKKHILLSSLVHAREPAGLNVNIAFIDNLLDEGNLMSDDIRNNILDKYVIHVIFIYNPIGYEIDNSSVYIINNELHNIPGIYYRKNGNMKNGNEQNILKIKKLYEDVIKNYINNNNVKIKISNQNNYGVDLNRNFGKFSSKLPKFFDFLINQKCTINNINNYGLNNYEKFKVLYFKYNVLSQELSDHLINHGLWNLNYNNDLLNDQYPGETSNSEMETINFQNYFTTYNFSCNISIHSCGNVLLKPFIYDIERCKINSLVPFFSINNDDYNMFINNCNKNGIFNVTNKNYKNIMYKDNKIYYGNVLNPITSGHFGNMLEWTYINNLYRLELNEGSNEFKTFILEVGNKKFGLYPKKKDMIDIIYHSTKALIDLINGFNDNK